MKRSLIFATFCILLSGVMGHTAPITIPSDDKIVSLTPSPRRGQALESWSHLPEYTLQTLENFNNGSPRGVLCVHSYEVISGIIPHFTKRWNDEHPHDQRLSVTKRDYDEDYKDFFTIFTPEEFVDHYVSYVLANRPLISSSILSFHEEQVYTNFSTFGPVSLILSVPPQCVTFTSYRDSYTHMDYWTEPSPQGVKKYKMYLKSELYPLDSLMRFSNVEPYYDLTDTTPSYKKAQLFSPVMNEIGVLSCANSIGKFYRPSVVGILINPHENSCSASDLGNGKFNKFLETAARAWISRHELPVIDLASLTRCVFSQEQLNVPAVEWRAIQTDGFSQKPCSSYLKRNDYIERDLRTREFRLTREQLNGYGLNPTPPLSQPTELSDLL